jgi:hypothetical protein
MKAYKSMKGQIVPNHRRRKGKRVESNIDMNSHNYAHLIFDKGSKNI